ncbi:EamA family transporter [Aliidiomarina minuta]|uniref:EamA family transporter n=1 Tax=Aliidiomarina minuta TaxID=880057 RepID=A0A432W8Z2_9GAMM|nr:EamA family transporter [Aliidiomarina minuta]RUO26525.1 EamA family transporter [Aliidiomarina minuta]
MAGASAVLVALAALFWGLSGGIGGILMADGWDAFVVSFYRGVIGLLCVLLWLALRPQGSGLANRRLWFWSALAGLGVAGNFAFYFISIDQGSVAVAATLMYCAPVFVYLVSFALQLESPTPIKWLSIGLVMVGVVLLTQIYDIGGSDLTMVGVSAGLLSGLSYAIFIFGFKYAAPHGSPQAILAIAFAVLTLILIWPGDNTQITAVLTTSDWPLFLGLGVLGAGLSFVIYIRGLNYTLPAVAAIVAMVEPVTASLFGVVVLGESLVASQFVGMLLILLTVTALSVHSESARPFSGASK